MYKCLILDGRGDVKCGISCSYFMYRKILVNSKDSFLIKIYFLRFFHIAFNRSGILRVIYLCPPKTTH